jgi:hypothetical protein
VVKHNEKEYPDNYKFTGEHEPTIIDFQWHDFQPIHGYIVGVEKTITHYQGTPIPPEGEFILVEQPNGIITSVHKSKLRDP